MQSSARLLFLTCLLFVFLLLRPPQASAQRQRTPSFVEEDVRGALTVSTLFQKCPLDALSQPCIHVSPFSGFERLLHGGRCELGALVGRPQNLTLNVSDIAAAPPEAPPLLTPGYFVDGVWGYIVGGIWLILGSFVVFLWLLCKLGKTGTLAFRIIPRWLRELILGRPDPSIPSTLTLASVNALMIISLLTSIVGLGLAYGANPKWFTTFHSFERLAKGELHRVTNETRNAAKAVNDASTVFATLPPQVLAQVGGEALPTALKNASQALSSLSSQVEAFVTHDIQVIYDVALALYITNYILLSLIVLTLLAELIAFAAASPRLMGAALLAHWLLTAWLWVWVGLNFDVSQAFKGECRILKHYLQDPSSTNNPLGARLPCGRLQFAQELLITGEQDASNVTAQIDSKVLPLASALASSVNATGPVPRPLCDPFNATAGPAGCVPAHTFVPEVVTYYQDLANRSPQIVQAIGLTPAQVASTGNVTLEVLDVIPQLTDLLFCTSIFATLNQINRGQCHTIRWATNLLWASLVVLAAGMMPLQLLGLYWVRYMRSVRKREEALVKAPAGSYMSGG